MDYLKMMPDTPPRGMRKRMLETAGWRQCIAYYWAKDRKTGRLRPDRAECWCSTCGKTFTADMLPGNTPGAYPKIRLYNTVWTAGERVNCPHCDTRAELAHKKRLVAYPFKSRHYPWSVKKSRGCIVFTNWLAEISIGWKNYGLDLTPRNAYIVTPEGKILRATTGERCGWSCASPMEYGCGWRMAYKNDIADDGMNELFGFRPGMFEGTALENAKLETIMAEKVTTRLLAYIRLYLRHRNVENLVNTCPNITREVLRRYEYAISPGGKLANISWLNWKAVRPHEILRMEKETMKQLEGRDAAEIAATLNNMEAQARGVRIGNPEKVKQYTMKLGDWWVLNELIRSGIVGKMGQTLEKATQYAACYTYADRSESQIAADALDYWKDALAAGFDLHNATVAFPRDLYEAQARATSAVEYAKNEGLRQKFEALTESLAALTWHWRGLFIRAAADPGELVQEGKALSHCVGGYSEAHAKGRCIFFIRHEDSPAESYFTLQLDINTGTVIQNRGRRNCERTEEVRQFEDVWLRCTVRPWLEAKKHKKRAKAARAA